LYELDELYNSVDSSMKTLEASQLREGFSDAMNIVAYTGQRISIRRYGKPVAVLVPVEDAAMLEAIEDRFDVAAAKKALKEKGSIPWAEVKRRSGLKTQ
jgi:prevent-host-death family protein